MRLALIGVGLIGGSFARAVKAAGKFDSIVGFDTDKEALRRAMELGVIDEQAASVSQAVAEASLVVIATPVGGVPHLFPVIAASIKRDAVITDVASTKASVVDAARALLGDAFVRFVPGHPIAGRERSGVEHADADLFRDKVFISTPGMQTDTEAMLYVEALWRAVGCRVERMTPTEHDRVFAAVSHLPHLLAFAFVACIAAEPDAKQKFAVAGSGFVDFTRIAASDPRMWADICTANRSALVAELASYRRLLNTLQQAVESGDGDLILEVFGRASQARRAHSAGSTPDPRLMHSD